MKGVWFWRFAAASAFAFNFLTSVIPLHSVLVDPLDFSTAFTPGHLLFVIWWIILFSLQFLYLLWFFFHSDSENDSSRATAPYFITFSLLQVLWSYLWIHKALWLSFIVSVISFSAIMHGYFALRTFSNSPLEYAFIHISTIAMPYSYLVFVIMWNGAAAVHAHSTFARIVANILVWVYLFIPTLHLALYSDWAIGFSFAYLTASLAVGQFFIKKFALQWIFATVISGIVGLSSLIIFGLQFIRGAADTALSDDTERSPLLHE